MEIFDMIEKAKAISSIFNTQEQESENTDNLTNQNDDENSSLNNNFENILNTVSFLKTLQESQIFAPAEKKETEEKEKQYLEENELQFNFNNPNIMSMKAMIPYLDLEYQKGISVFIKIMEMRHILNYYKNMTTTMSFEKKDDIKKGMLLAIKPQLNSQNQPFIDVVLKTLEIKDIIGKTQIKEEDYGI